MFLNAIFAFVIYIGVIMDFSNTNIMVKWLFRCLVVVFVASSLASCIPQKRIVLVQNKDNGDEVFDKLDSITNKYRLQVNDYLYVTVTSPDPKLSSFFNPMQMGSMSSTMSSKEFYYYLVDDNMDIEFPVVGKINLKGCNLESAREKIKKAISGYLNEFDVTVHLASNTYTILGEVNKQGQIAMTRDQITIFDAIGNAGGFTSYAKRSSVKLLRKDVDGKIHTYFLDLTDDNIINSDFYYIYPNDVLYVRPLRAKTFGFGEVLSTQLATTVTGLVTSFITLYLLIKSLD